MVTLLPMLPSRDQRGTNSSRRTICSTNNRNVEQDTLCGDPKRYLSGLSINKKLVGFPNRTVAMRVPAGERGEIAVPARSAVRKVLVDVAPRAVLFLVMFHACSFVLWS